MISTLEYIIGGLIGVLSVVIVVCISKQQSKRRGLGNSIAGQGASESYLSRNKIASNEKKLQKLTLILAIVWAALIVVLFCLSSVDTGNSGTESSADTSKDVSVVESAVESAAE